MSLRKRVSDGLYQVGPGRYYQPTYRRIAEAFVPQEGQVVDLGCGPGWVAVRMAERAPRVEVIGIDPAKIWSPRDETEDMSTICVERMDGAQMSLESNTVDVVMASRPRNWTRADAVLGDRAYSQAIGTPRARSGPPCPRGPRWMDSTPRGFGHPPVVLQVGGARDGRRRVVFGEDRIAQASTHSGPALYSHDHRGGEALDEESPDPLSAHRVRAGHVASGLVTGLLVVGTGQDVGDGEQGGIILGVVGTAIGMITGLAYARTKAPASAFSLRPCSLEWAVYGIALVAPVLGFGYGWASFLEWLGVGTQPQTYVDAMLRSSDLTTLVISGLYGVLGAAIFEELRSAASSSRRWSLGGVLVWGSLPKG